MNRKVSKDVVDLQQHSPTAKQTLSFNSCLSFPDHHKLTKLILFQNQNCNERNKIKPIQEKYEQLALRMHRQGVVVKSIILHNSINSTFWTHCAIIQPRKKKCHGLGQWINSSDADSKITLYT